MDTIELLQALRSSREEERRKAIDSLVKLEDPPSSDLKSELERLVVEDPSLDIRFHARHLLHRWRGKLRNTPRPMPAVHTVLSPVELLSSQDPEERLGAVDALSRSGDRSMRGAIIQAMSWESDPQVLARLVSALKDLGTAEDIQLLVPFLQSPDARIVANAVESLVSLGGEDLLNRLMPLLVNPDNRVRANLMLALATRYRSQVTGFVRRMLKAQNAAYRASALYCARHLDHSEFYREIIRMCATEPESRVLESALRWIEELAVFPDVGAEIEVLRGSRPEIAGELDRIKASLMKKMPSRPAAPAPRIEDQPSIVIESDKIREFRDRYREEQKARGVIPPVPELRPTSGKHALTSRSRSITVSPPAPAGRLAVVAGWFRDSALRLKLPADSLAPGSRGRKALLVAGAAIATVLWTALLPGDRTGVAAPETEEPTPGASAGFERDFGDLKVTVTGVTEDVSTLEVAALGSIYQVRLKEPLLPRPRPGDRYILVRTRQVHVGGARTFLEPDAAVPAR